MQTQRCHATNVFEVIRMRPISSETKPKRLKDLMTTDRRVAYSNEMSCVTHGIVG